MEDLNNKIKRLTSAGAWGIIGKDGKEEKLSDGPNGLRIVYKEENGYQFATPSFCYPTLSALASSWDEKLIYEIAKCIGNDCRMNDIGVILGPGVNIKRTPLCGRNFEYFSEDPILAGNMGYSYILGVQSQGVGTSLKHFACNNREYDRFYQSSEVDERTLREIYLKPFEIALKAKPWTVMCSYNMINGVLASENIYLLKEILREKFKYDGTVISDWGSVRNRAKSLYSGIDLAFPYDENFDKQVYDAYQEKYIDDSTINESIKNIDSLIKKINDGKKMLSQMGSDCKNGLIQKAAEQSMVLLKNENILPLGKSNRILLVGEFLDKPIICGGGSANVNPNIKIDSLLEALTNIDKENKYEFEQGYMMRYGLATPFGYKKCLEKAYKANLVIVGVGDSILEEKEETDREKIKMCKAFEDLIEKICELNQNVIVVLYAGSVIDVSSFENKVKAIILANYSGQKVNNALANILLGYVNPSGRLAETWPKCIEDTFTKLDVGNAFNEIYYDHTLVGYRYYDAKKIDVRYPFGFGLSYSNFIYSNLNIVKRDDTTFEISFNIYNDSDNDGYEVPQLYIKPVGCCVYKKYRELKKYQKVFIKAHESKQIVFKLSREDFEYYSVITHNNYLEDGVYQLYISKNVNDPQLYGDIEIKLNNFFQFSKY